MGQFIGIQLPDALRGQIADFGRQRQYISTEPHITVLGNSLVGDIGGLEQKLETFCLNQKEFSVIVAGPNQRPGEMVFLTVLSGDLGPAKDKLAQYLRVPLPKNKNPHYITLVRSQAGRTVDYDEVLRSAQREFHKPFTFTVEGLTLYSQPHDRAHYKPVATYTFTGR